MLSPLSCPRAPQLSRNTAAYADFLGDKGAVLGDTIKETACADMLDNTFLEII
jgi:hypothetical protein